MLPDRMIEDAAVRRRGDEFAVSIRIPWYRSLPLSSISALALSIDGEDATPGTLTWTVNGTTYRPDELPALWQDWWNVLDSALLSGTFAGEHGDEVDVEAQVGIYIPYLPAGDGYLQVVERTTKHLPVTEGA